MSADLFAEFEDFSQPPKPSPSPQAPSGTPQPQQAQFNSDPFAFIVPPSAAAPIQPDYQSQQWPTTFQQQQPHSPPVVQQPSIPGWGDFGSVNSASPAAQNVVEEDDGWGDFEVAPSAFNSTSSVSAKEPNVFIPPAQPKQAPGPVRTRVIRASTLDLMTNNLVDVPGSPALPKETSTPSWKQTSFETYQAPRSNAPVKTTKADPNVLFDADDFDGQAPDDEDDFGDFETSEFPAPKPATDLMSNDIFSMATPAQKPATDVMSNDIFSMAAPVQKPPTKMLSALNLNEKTSPYPQAPKSPAFRDRNPFPGMSVKPAEAAVAKSTQERNSPITAWPTFDDQPSSANAHEAEEWATFEDLPAEPKPKPATSKQEDTSWNWDSIEPAEASPKKAKPAVKLASKPAAPPATQPSNDSDSNWDWDTVEAAPQTPAQLDEDAPPPMNIPPPSVLLSIFPQLLGEANTALYKPIAGQSITVKNRILSDPKTIEFLNGYLCLATVAARIIAGRKPRWHRDKFLAQSMSISAAGGKGMKLAGVDKTQAAREDREAADVVSAWKENVGRLRSAVATSNSSIKSQREHLKVPEISEQMPVQTAKMVPTAAKACCICGLKREERVSKVDFEVEDSFGEWWSDHWGHTSCKRFWLEHEVTLRQR